MTSSKTKRAETSAFRRRLTRCRTSLPWAPGAGSIGRGGRPVPAAHPRPIPAVPHHNLPWRRPGPRAAGRWAPFPARRPPILSIGDAFHSGPFQKLDLPPGAPSGPGKTSHRLLPGGCPRARPESARQTSPQASPRPAEFSRTHRLATLGAPASSPRGPVGGGGGGRVARRTGRTAGRTDAQARSHPRSRRLPPPTHTRTHTHTRVERSGRERGSARNPWNEAPSALTRALRAPPGPPGHAPGSAPPTEQVGPSPGELAVGRGRGLARPGEALFPSPARRAPGGSSHLRAGADVLGRRTSAEGPEPCRAPRRTSRAVRARGPSVSHTPESGPREHTLSAPAHENLPRAQVPAAVGQARSPTHTGRPMPRGDPAHVTATSTAEPHFVPSGPAATATHSQQVPEFEPDAQPLRLPGLQTRTGPAFTREK